MRVRQRVDGTSYRNLPGTTDSDSKLTRSLLFSLLRKERPKFLPEELMSSDNSLLVFHEDSGKLVDDTEDLTKYLGEGIVVTRANDRGLLEFQYNDG